MGYPFAKFGHCTFSSFGFIAPWPLTFDLLTWYSFVGEVPLDGLFLCYDTVFPQVSLNVFYAMFGDFGLSCFGFIVRTD